MLRFESGQRPGKPAPSPVEAARLKNIGNELFKQQKYEEAIIQYAAAIGRLCALDWAHNLL